MAGSGTAHLRAASDVLLRVEHLVVSFPAGGGREVSAVADLSIDIAAGETLSLVGESGCGKSSTGRAIVQLPRPTSGRIVFGSTDLAGLSGQDLRAVRPQMQMVFQDPISSLNPRRTVRQIVAEPLRIWKRAAGSDEHLDALLEAVGLDRSMGDRRPHELSGGQCQRVSIARSIVLEPKLLICDEPVSALDVSVQAQILNLLHDLKQRYGLTLLFVSHDLAVVKNVSDRVAVMYLGKLCEVGDPERLYARPAHPYTAELLASVPNPDPTAERHRSPVVVDEMPSPIDPPSGCRFRTRCPRATARCEAEEPELRPVDPDGTQFVACHFPLVGGS